MLGQGELFMSGGGGEGMLYIQILQICWIRAEGDAVYSVYLQVYWVRARQVG